MKGSILIVVTLAILAVLILVFWAGCTRLMEIELLKEQVRKMAEKKAENAAAARAAAVTAAAVAAAMTDAAKTNAAINRQETENAGDLEMGAVGPAGNAART